MTRFSLTEICIEEVSGELLEPKSNLRRLLGEGDDEVSSDGAGLDGVVKRGRADSFVGLGLRVKLLNFSGLGGGVRVRRPLPAPSGRSLGQPCLC